MALLPLLRLPRSQLGRELLIAVAVKLTIIGLAALFIFGPRQRPQIDAHKLEMRILGNPAAASAEAPSHQE
jgi:hypothetical protein